MKRLTNCLITLLWLAASFPSYASDPMAALAQYCATREASTRLMVQGRDSGISKDQVLAKLPAGTSDAELATQSRLNDVYRFSSLDADTLESFRMSSCMFQGMAGGVEPKFDKGLESALQSCQRSETDRQSCVIAASKASLVSSRP